MDVIKRKVALWGPAVLWMGAIFVFSSLPGADFSSGKIADFTIRKLLHLVEYGLLTFALYRGSRNIGFSVILAIVYGLTDELHQTLIPTRTGKVMDFFIDGVGALVAGFILWRYLQALPRKLKEWLLI